MTPEAWHNFSLTMAIGIGIPIVRAIFSALGRKLNIHWKMTGALEARICFILVALLMLQPYSIKTLKVFVIGVVVSLFWSWISSHIALIWVDWWNKTRWNYRALPVYLTILGSIAIPFLTVNPASMRTIILFVLFCTIAIAVPLSSLVFIKSDQSIKTNPVFITMASYCLCMVPIAILVWPISNVQAGQVASLWAGWMLGGCAAAIFGFSQLQDLVCPRLINEISSSRF
jgi:hypothetical protein